MIKFDHVTKRYPGSNEALTNVSFTIEAGEMVFVTGHSGAGKSTLLKMVAGLLPPTDGRLLLWRKPLDQLEASGHVVAGSARALGTVKTGVAVKAGEAAPSVGTPDAPTHSRRLMRSLAVSELASELVPNTARPTF